MANPERLKTEGESGYAYAKENFDRQILADKYLSHIEQILI